MKYALYIHIPFCERKCFYCSFVVSVGQEHRMQDYISALIMEMKKYQGKTLKTIYLGGGTPSFLDAKSLTRLMDVLRQNFHIEDDAEITIEINPRDLDLEKVKCLPSLGFNRFSVGAQTFNDDHLRYLGRVHASDDIRKTADLLQAAGITNISFDLMFGFPGQTSADIQRDIKAMSSFHPKHISLYSLTIEENSRFFTKNIQLNDPDQQAEHYNLVVQEVSRVGLSQYEISNFAAKGFESRHNLNYWEDGEYIGLGIGAHSYIQGRRSWNISKLPEYIQRLNEGTSVEEGSKELSATEQMMDAFLFGLRMNKGISLRKIEMKYHQSFDPNIFRKLKDFQNGGWIIQDHDCYRATDKGRMVLDELCAQLI